MLIELADDGDAIRSNMMAPVNGRNVCNIRIIYVAFGLFLTFNGNSVICKNTRFYCVDCL